MTKLRLGVHTLRIQTGKYKNKGASIPVYRGKSLCLVCKRNYIEDEKHFFLVIVWNMIVLETLFSYTSENDANFTNLTDHDRTLLTLDNDNTSQVIAKNAFQTEMCFSRLVIFPQPHGNSESILHSSLWILYS